MSSPLLIQNLFNVNGLVVVITGGGSGLGSYAAKALDANGAKAVYIVGRREESLKQVASQATNGTIIPVVGDVTDNDSLAAVAARIRKEQGYVNVLFANAGVLGPLVRALVPKDPSGPNGKPSIAEFQEAMLKPSQDDFSVAGQVNVTGPFYTAVAFADLLDAGNKKGNVPQNSQIIITSSIAGFSRAVSAGFAYSTSKAGATHLVKMLATYFGDYNIRANAIAPGLYPSEMTSEMLRTAKQVGNGEAFEGAISLPRDSCPAERTGSEQDFAGVILFLMSRAGAYINGETLVTDGGRLSQLPSTY